MWCMSYLLRLGSMWPCDDNHQHFTACVYITAAFTPWLKGQKLLQTFLMNDLVRLIHLVFADALCLPEYMDLKVNHSYLESLWPALITVTGLATVTIRQLIW